MVFHRPLNPPILGDFQLIIPPKVGGLGGQKHTSNQQCQKTSNLKSVRRIMTTDQLLMLVVLLIPGLLLSALVLGSFAKGG
jgi:hypothetical protein